MNKAKRLGNLRFTASTDTGLVREINEDSYGVFPTYGLFVVCDGMGGHAAGDYASQKVIETISGMYENDSKELYRKLKDRFKNIDSEEGRRLAVQVMLANRRLFRLAVMYPKLRGMGTTLTGALFEKGFVNIVNVGDSRTYLFRNSRLRQLSVDHSWVEEMLQDGEIKEQELDNFKAKNVITRALGTNPSVKIDHKALKTEAGDIYILCSDGLCGEISDSKIESVISESLGSGIDEIPGRLIEAAKQAGGSDNITVAAVQVIEEQPFDGKIETESIVTVDEDKPVLDVLDSHIDKKLPPSKTEVPEGVEKDKPKKYHSPVFNILILLLLFIIGAAIYARHQHRTITSGIDLSSISMGDILIRTNPSGARVSITKIDGEYSDERTSPADFVSLEEGEYRIIVEKNGFEEEIIKVDLGRGLQETRRIELSPLQQVYLTIGTDPGFDTSEEVILNGEPFIYYGRPLTVGRIGFAGRRISVEKDRVHELRVGDQKAVIDASSAVDDEVIEVRIESGSIHLP